MVAKINYVFAAPRAEQQGNGITAHRKHVREIIKHWTEADVRKKTWLVLVFFVILILAFMKE